MLNSIMGVTPDLVCAFFENRSDGFGFGDAVSFRGLVNLKCLKGIKAIGSCGRKMIMDFG